MSTTTIDPEDETQFDEPCLQLELLLVYEDVPTGRRGKLALDRALNRLEVSADGHFRAWRLDMLGNPTFRAAATQDAFDADIMALSIHGDNRLEPAALDYLEQWVGLKRSKPRVLLIFLDAIARPLAESNLKLLGLRAEAARHGLTVLLQFDAAPLPEMRKEMAGSGPRAETPPPLFKPVLRQPESIRRWGINE